jgi:hypothetical protein
MVADLNLDGDPNKLAPSIVFSSFFGPHGRIATLRIVDGRTCEEQFALGDPEDPDDADRPEAGSQFAIGDLNGDVPEGGRPEIVGMHRLPGPLNEWAPNGTQPIAWEITGTPGTLELRTLWKARVCGGVNDEAPIKAFQFAAPVLADLNDDGSPEIVIGQLVLDSSGCVLNEDVRTADDPQAAVVSGQGTMADVDLDGSLELVTHEGIYEWNAGSWVLEDYASAWTAAVKKGGRVALADLGHYSALDGRPATDPFPEIIVVSQEVPGYEPRSTGAIRAFTLTGDILFSRELPFNDPCDDTDCFGGHGGPPTASDFDGDGQVEFAASGNVFYTVFDPDCLSGGVPSERPGGQCAQSSENIPPAGQRDGVLWAVPSQDFSSSATGSSVFDFNGDGKSEVMYRDEVQLRVLDGATGDLVYQHAVTSGTGSEYPVVADVDGDFASELVVVGREGLFVLREPEDRWVSSRPIWNQHDYSVTHVNDDATIPRTSDWVNNWEVEGLNNYRQNAQGRLGATALADLTVELDDLGSLCDADAERTQLSARVCNRGTNPVSDGALVTFRAQSSDGEDAGSICSVTTETLLDVGDCTKVTCEGEWGKTDNVIVDVDPEGEIADCHPGNNMGSGSQTLCEVVVR